MISTVVEVSEAMHNLIQAYLKTHPTASSDQVIQAALQMFMEVNHG